MYPHNCDSDLCREFDDTIDALQGDIEALEGEKIELKEKIKLLSKKTLLEGLSHPGAGQSGTVVAVAVVLAPDKFVYTLQTLAVLEPLLGIVGLL